MFNSVSEMVHDKVFLKLKGFALSNLSLKIEAFNPAGSVKLKTALGLVGNLERAGTINQDTILIESSSGNLGVALSMICAERGYRFLCVADPNTSHHNIKIMKSFGAEVVVVTQRDANGGFLGTRIDYVMHAVASDKRYIWLNQYANPENPRAHMQTTARAIAETFDRLDYVFIGAGTSGTLMGCVEYLKEHRPQTRVIAVDSVGSVTFGFPPGKRFIPGLGSSQRPPIYNPEGIHAFEMIPEADTITMCRRVARTNGLLIGGSTGTVLAAVDRWSKVIPPDSIVVAISPDLGDRYLDTIYDEQWVEERFSSTEVWPAEAPKSPRQAGIASSSGTQDHCFHVVPGDVVKALLNDDLRDSIRTVEETYRAHRKGDTNNPHSYFLRFPDAPRNRIIALPASISGDKPISGIKWIASFPGNVDSGLPRASATLLLNDPVTGFPIACLEAAHISATRTAASAVLAAYWLNERVRSAGSICFIGAGVISRSILDMFNADDWTFTSSSVFDIDPGSSLAFRSYAKRSYAIDICDAETLENAISADIVVFATNASSPYVQAPLSFRRGQIVLNISLRDISPNLLATATNVLDDVEHCLKADTSPHLTEKMLGHRDFVSGTLAALMAGALRLDREKPLIFSPFGLGILDLALGRKVLEVALQQGRAIEIPNFFGSASRW
jgi:2,3-diaminopropionate biosynthesis protein SbnA/2,3-diaminopropionate biosynthesis protein SbnB